ncbi:hypothetical protein CN692_10915 [Bacillus sp. AFS002410]|uniref:hypothetical protein n=1 Tax=Bacillus sp. AFS002410 TaxID=2033481 RepID=UPI000BF2447B|nr:hypothetical protein [Bacillus sp. AFS002410]PEJ57992.1 hypothetical protein CN692_10915 [Bacillus sp. AFS002410]
MQKRIRGMMKMDLNRMVEIVNVNEKALWEFSDSNDFLELFDKDDNGGRDIEEKNKSHKEACKVVKDLAEILEKNGYERTKDTGRFLQEGEEAFYIEGAYEWYDSKVAIIKDCYKSGMTKKEIKECLFDYELNPEGHILLDRVLLIGERYANSKESSGMVYIL